MSKKASSSLFQLIKSLSKGEKRNFKLFANYFSAGKKNYLRLFEIIDRQKQYDEQIIKELLKKEKIKKPLAQLKVYLLDLILKSLRFHHSNRTIDGQLRNLLTDTELCHRKGLKNLRNKLLVKAKHISSHHEKYETALIVLNKELEYTPMDILNANIFDEHTRIRQTIEKKNEYRCLLIKTMQLLKEGAIRDGRLKNEWNKLIQNQIIKKGVPSGFVESSIYYQIWAIYYERVGDFKKCAYYQELIITKLESRPEMLKELSIRYMSGLNNLIIVRLLMNDTEKAKEAMNKLIKMQEWELQEEEKNQLNNTILSGYGDLIPGLLYTNPLNEIVSVTAKAEFFVQTKNSDAYYKSTVFPALVISHLFTGNFNKAFFWNNKFLNDPHADQLEDVYNLGRIFNLILHYELGHIDLLPYIARSTYRFLYKRKRLYKTEDAILHFIRNKMTKANSPKELLRFFKELKTELEEITKDSYEANALKHFNFIIWLESKIQNCSMSEIVKIHR